MRKEIEVKARVSDPDAVHKRLEELGCQFSEPIVQQDQIFVDKDYGPFEQFQSGKNVLRIRNSKGKFLLTLKQPQKNELDCLEYETEISDPEALREALLLMGYRKAVEVHKTRIKTKYDGCEINLDNIRDLGDYIEMERIADDADSERVQEELFSFLETVGVRREDRETRGYDTLTYLKQNNLPK